MRPLPFLFVLALSFTGCDTIYERPERPTLFDFGAPYTLQIDAARDAVVGEVTPPYVTSDNRLIVDVTIDADCDGSRFRAMADLRDPQSADVWLLHSVRSETCGTASPLDVRLELILPTFTRQIPRLLLHTPGQGTIALSRRSG